MTTVTHRQGAPDCPDCITVTADNGDRIAAGIRQCPRCRSASAENMEAARQANPEIAALHRMIGRG